MAEHREADPLAPSEPPLIDLFMTVVKVAEWSLAVRWYTDTLGLASLLLDPEHEFALLAAGQSRLGLQGVKVKGERAPAGPSRVRLVFQVRDVDVERLRLVERGVEVSAPRYNREEGYREVRLHDPDGNRLTLFSWLDATRARGLNPDRPDAIRSDDSAETGEAIEGLPGPSTMS